MFQPDDPQRHISNYTLPERNQCWDASFGPVEVPEAVIEGVDVELETVRITTTYDSSAPSFPLPHDRRENLRWTIEQSKWAEQGEEVKDIEDLRIKVSDIFL